LRALLAPGTAGRAFLAAGALGTARAVLGGGQHMSCQDRRGVHWEVWTGRSEHKRALRGLRGLVHEGRLVRHAFHMCMYIHITMMYVCMYLRQDRELRMLHSRGGRLAPLLLLPAPLALTGEAALMPLLDANQRLAAS
jgi:hypothetical protein